ncbi:hypothetical protein ACHAW6_009588 [Cyclotella cf. meneghiniana]
MYHHSPWMLGVCQKYPGHPFSKILLLNSPLLQELVSEHVTLELNAHVPAVTGNYISKIESMLHMEEQRSEDSFNLVNRYLEHKGIKK